MSGQSENARAGGGRWLAAAALAGLTLVALALVWGGLAPARAQDQTKWWGGAAAIRPCPPHVLEPIFEAIGGGGPKRQSFGCDVSIGKSGTVAALLYQPEGPYRVQLNVLARKVCQGAAQGPGCSGSVYSDGWRELSCRDATSIAADILVGIAAPFSAGPPTCSFKEFASYSDRQTSHRYIEIQFQPAPLKAKAAETCDKATFLGPWKNDHAKYARYGASVTFEKSVIKGEVTGRFSLRKENHNTQYILGNVISTVGPPKGCLFTANRDSSMRQREGLKYDKATDSFTITMADGSPNPDFPGRWTRGAPPKAAATCGKDDINGTWHRGDGARILMTGVGVFGGGGHAIMQRYPEDRWPKGEMKFRGVKEVSECRYEASCTTINRRTSNGVASYGVTEAACTLTLDPVKRTLSATGGSGVFRREATAEPTPAPAPAKAAAEDRAQAARRESEAEAARTAALNAEVTRRNAEVQRRNAEVKAADERRQAEYRAALARQKAEADRIRREDAEAKRKYEAEMAAWRARVAACKAGDVAQCGS